ERVPPSPLRPPRRCPQWRRFHHWHPRLLRAANSTSTTPNPHGVRPDATYSTRPQRYTPKPRPTSQHSLAKAESLSPCYSYVNMRSTCLAVAASWSASRLKLYHSWRTRRETHRR